MTDGASDHEVVEITELLPLGGEIGAGIHGVVYELPGRPGVVLKRYRSGVSPDDDALDRLIRWRLDLPGPAQTLVDQRASFPLARVIHDGATTGVLLPSAPTEFRSDDGAVVSLEDFVRSTGSEVAITRVVLSLAELLSMLDDHDVTHGEVSTGSVLASTVPPYVFVLDCDVASVGAARPGLSRSTASTWTDPRIVTGEVDRADRESDRLALGRVFFYTYFGANSASEISAFPPSIPSSPPITHDVRSCLVGALQPSAPRQTAGSWVRALVALEGQLADPASPLAEEFANSAAEIVEASLPELSELPPPPVEDTASVLRSLPPPGLPNAIDGASDLGSQEGDPAPSPRSTVKILTVVTLALLALVIGFGAGFAITGALT